MGKSRGGGGGFFYSKDAPPARVYFFRLPVKKRVYFWQFSLGKGMLFGNLGQEKSNVGNSCVKTQILQMLVQ